LMLVWEKLHWRGGIPLTLFTCLAGGFSRSPAALTNRAGFVTFVVTLGRRSYDASAVANLVTLLTFSVVGAIIASRHPRNTIGWLFCSVGVTIGL